MRLTSTDVTTYLACVYDGYLNGQFVRTRFGRKLLEADLNEAILRSESGSAQK